MDLTRRSLLVAVAATAGCTAPAGDTVTRTATADSGGPAANPSPTMTPDDGSPTTAPDGGSPTKTDELDLREANVVGVEWSGDPGGDVRFSVTLYHDDDGEEGYANWWQVETLDGEQLGRRKLLHAHSTAPFTRSETIAVPGDVDCVVVRGHDQTHGYGGQAMLVNLVSGATATADQGPERQSFSEADCP